MQFQNPQILYFLPLLIIPILIHLFQLQKFEKIPFTNVAFLQRIVQENRKSSELKKWLILATRLLLFLAILFAFSQPYFSNKDNNKKQHNFIYLDSSLSNTAIGERGNLLKIASQNIIDNASKLDEYSLQTNTAFFENITYDELKNQLLNIKSSAKKLDFESILLKIDGLNKNKTNTLNKNILISDFQYKYRSKFTNVTGDFSVIKLKSSTKNNISIDSVYVNNTTNESIQLNVFVKNQGDAKENIPIAIYDSSKLLSKQSLTIDANSNSTTTFTLNKTENIRGKITITFSDTFNFDNTFYFTLNEIKKVNVLTIGNTSKFLKKIYTKEEFNYTENSLQNLNYNSLQNQELILLNELTEIPEILSRSLNEFTQKGGTLIIIPNSKSVINSYNNFLKTFSNFRISNLQKDSLKITQINFDHPIFKDVFSKKIRNFQYPSVSEFYKNNGRNINPIIQFENGSPFVGQINSSNKKVYWISSSLSTQTTNFSNSPLIVPLFYNFGKLSFNHTQLYYHIDRSDKIDIETKLGKDEILSITKDNSSFIPQQQSYQNKVSLSLQDQIEGAGFYHVIKQQDTIKTLAFNNPKEESLLTFLDVNELKKDNNKIEIYDSIADVFNELNKKNEVHWLWKWFLALAIVSLLAEILILKFYKP